MYDSMILCCTCHRTEVGVSSVLLQNEIKILSSLNQATFTIVKENLYFNYFVEDIPTTNSTYSHTSITIYSMFVFFKSTVPLGSEFNQKNYFI